jgi:hypothetical protein
MRKSIIILNVIAVVAILFFVYRATMQDRGPQVVEDDRSGEFEILTILGDVRYRDHNMPGRWRPARGADDTAAPSDAEAEKLDELTALPYLQGSTMAPEVQNVTRYDAERAYTGVNVYTSGHEPAAFLMDMTGKVLHKWQYDVHDAWPAVPLTIHNTFWRRVHAYPNGDLLAIFEGIGLLKLNKDSELLWSYGDGCHHEAYVTDDGRIYVLTRKARMEPRINQWKPILTDYITILNDDGERIVEYPLLEIFEKSAYPMLMRGARPYGDMFHTNSIRVLDGSMAKHWPHFKRGNVLISMRRLSAIAIVDLEKQAVVWASMGGWKRQHDPTVLPDGSIMLFDNMGRPGKLSRVIKFDPRSMLMKWQYHGINGELHSKTCGTARLLPNGNILITESDNGRSLEISADKEPVWEFYNPHRAGDDDELIATLFELIRYDSDYFPWLAN